MRTNSVVQVGICGLGRSGYGIHCQAIRDMPDQFQVAGVYDPLQHRAWEVAESFDAICYDSFDAMLADPAIELVVVASKNLMHATQARMALEAGKHVICEKPFGLTTADVDAMMTAATVNGGILQPFQQRRYEPDFCQVKTIMESGILGEIQFVRICWHGFKRRWDWQSLFYAQ